MSRAGRSFWNFAEQNQIPIAKDKKWRGTVQSVDANLLHTSSEGKVLEDPGQEAPDYVHISGRSISPEDGARYGNCHQMVEITFAEGRRGARSTARRCRPATILQTRLNDYGRCDTGIGRLDLVENRFVGMKSAGRSTKHPAARSFWQAHRGPSNQITLDSGAAPSQGLDLMPRYAELIYNGFWFSPEREMLQALIDKSQEHVEGEVTLKLYKGNVMVTGRESAKSLYSDKLVTFEDDQGAYDQKDAAGFIKLNALRLRTLAKRNLGK